MKILDCKPTDVMFTHIDPDTGRNINFNVTRLEAFCSTIASTPYRFTVPIDPDHAKHILKVRGLEQHRLDRLRRS